MAVYRLIWLIDECQSVLAGHLYMTGSTQVVGHVVRYVVPRVCHMAEGLSFVSVSKT